MSPGGPGPTRWPGRGGVPVAHVARQAWATRGTLVMCVLVVALVTCVASATPRFMDRAATAEVRASVGAGASDGTLVVSLPDDDDAVLELRPDTAARFVGRARQITAGLPATVAGVLTTPIGSLVGPELKAGTAGDLPVRLRFAYLLDAAQGPDGLGTQDVTTPDAGAVTWVEGRPPSTPTTPTRAGATNVWPIPVEVGVSEAVATVLGVRVGDTLSVQDPGSATVDATVTGIFRAADPEARVWDVLPTAVTPRRVPGAEGRVEVAALVGAASLAAAKYDVPGPRWTWSFTFQAVPDALDAHNARDAAHALAALASAPSELLPGELPPRITTRLDRMLGGALDRIGVAAAQATLVVSGVVATALLVLMLATSLLVRRRTRVLSHQRALGATLVALAGAAAAESLAVVAVGAAVGVALGAALVPGPVPWTWVAPPLVLACATAPALVVRAAGRSAAPPPARTLDNRIGRGVALRRPLIEATLVILAAGALAILRARGATAAAGRLSSDLVILAAPVLVAAAVAALLLRVLPPAARGWRRLASGARGPVPLVAAARAPVNALPVLALVLVTALLTVVLTVRATVTAGQVAGSWWVVGADATLTERGGSGLPEDLATELARAPGVTAVATADLSDGAQVLGEGADVSTRLVAVDSRSAAALLAATPLPNAPALTGLAGEVLPVSGGPVRALATGLPPGATGLTLHWEREAIPIEVVGPAPALSTGDAPAPPVTVVVDRAALAAAVGRSVPATVLWATGPGAATAATDLAAGATVTTREGWLADLRSSPIATAFDALLVAATALLTGLGVLVVVLAAAGGAPERGRVLVGLRVLGMSRRSGGRLVLAELVGPVLAPALAGIATGVGLSLAVVGALGLNGLTGQAAGPALVLPWSVGLSVLALGASVAAVAAAERPRAGHEQLGQVLRSG